jgi:hypothetical protein
MNDVCTLCQTTPVLAVQQMQRMFADQSSSVRPRSVFAGDEVVNRQHRGGAAINLSAMSRAPSMP